MKQGVQFLNLILERGKVCVKAGGEEVVEGLKLLEHLSS